MKKIVICLLALTITSCFSQKVVQKKIIPQLKTLLDNEKTDIRSLLDIDGYYQRQVTLNNSKDSSDFNIMFFDDGTFTSNFFFKENLNKNQIKHNMSNAVRRWNEKGKHESDGYYWGGYWGTYRIEGDTIIGQDFHKGNWYRDWMFYEVRYIVINRTTLKIIYNQSLLRDNPYIKDPYDISKKNLIDKFIPADSLPSSDCWLKEEKWIWRNEQDWKDYMERIKQKKKKISKIKSD